MLERTLVKAYSSNSLERTAANLECGILGADTTLLPVSWDIDSQLDNEIGRGITRHSYQGKTYLSPSGCGRSLVTQRDRVALEDNFPWRGKISTEPSRNSRTCWPRARTMVVCRT